MVTNENCRPPDFFSSFRYLQFHSLGHGGGFHTGDSDLFKTVITYILLVVGAVLVVGFFIEVVRWMRKRRRGKSLEASVVVA